MKLWTSVLILAAVRQGGATLDFDDVARETDQDRGEGRAPFPEDRLSDGGGCGAARVVPGHSGKDWAVEIGNRDVRMKEETQQSHENNGNHGRGVFASGRNRACEPKKAPKQPRCQRKIEGEPKKELANLWSRQRIKKNHEKGLRRSWARSHMGNVSLLDVGGAYPNEEFSVVEFHGDSDYHELVKVEGETISVTGMIKDYRGKPEIIISSPTDISD